MAAVPKALPVQTPQLELRPSMPRLRTDGECLILTVQIDGKKYDLRIWKYDSEGEAIRLDEKTPFSPSAIVKIQQAAQNIFGTYFDATNRTEKKIRYWADPEMLTSGDEDITGHDMQSEAQVIHRCLFPDVRSDTSGTIYPTFIARRPVIQSEKNESSQIDQVSLPPSQNENVSVDNKPKEEVDSTFLYKIDEDAKEHRPQFFKGLTYSDLSTYSKLPSKDPKDSLYEAYSIYRKVITGEPCSDTEKERVDEMAEWIKNLYIAACHEYKNLREQFEYDCKQGKPVWDQSFEEWVKYYAAYDVVAFIELEKVDLEPYVNKLIQIDPDIAVN